MSFQKGHKGYRTKESYKKQAKKYTIWNKGISLITKKCQECGKLFTSPKWRIKNQKFCSIQCSNKSKVGQKRSKIICEKISDKLTGRKLSEKCKKKKSKYMIDLFKKNPERLEKFLEAGKKNRVRYKTPQGFLVRSRAEQEIAIWFYNKKIRIKYESIKIFFKDCFFVPDFFLPKYDLFIEYYGNFRNGSNKRNKKKKRLYKKMNLNIIEIEEVGYKKIKEVLDEIWQLRSL